MKIAFLLLSILCAVAVSMLMYTLRAGHLPFKPAVEPPPPSNPELTSKGIDLFLDGRSKAVDELINALAAERQLTAKKAAELAAREEELRIQSETVTRLTAELKDAQDPAGPENCPCRGLGTREPATAGRCVQQDGSGQRLHLPPGHG